MTEKEYEFKQIEGITYPVEKKKMTEKEKIIEEPVLTIEDISAELLSERFVNWYFKDEKSSEIISLYKEKAFQSKDEEVLKIIDEWYKENSKFVNHVAVFKLIQKLKENKHD